MLLGLRANNSKNHYLPLKIAVFRTFIWEPKCFILSNPKSKHPKASTLHLPRVIEQFWKVFLTTHFQLPICPSCYVSPPLPTSRLVVQHPQGLLDRRQGGTQAPVSSVAWEVTWLNGFHDLHEYPMLTTEGFPLKKSEKSSWWNSPSFQENRRNTF